VPTVWVKAREAFKGVIERHDGRSELYLGKRLQGEGCCDVILAAEQPLTMRGGNA
jgi:hypothetical protein